MGARRAHFEYHMKSERRDRRPSAAVTRACYRRAMEPPLAHLVGQSVPDLTLPLPDGQPMHLRAHVGHGPQVLFFFIRNGTPG